MRTSRCDTDLTNWFDSFICDSNKNNSVVNVTTLFTLYVLILYKEPVHKSFFYDSNHPFPAACFDSLKRNGS